MIAISTCGFSNLIILLFCWDQIRTLTGCIPWSRRRDSVWWRFSSTVLFSHTIKLCSMGPCWKPGGMGSCLRPGWTARRRSWRCRLDGRHIGNFFWFLVPCMFSFLGNWWVVQYFCLGRNRSPVSSNSSFYPRRYFQALCQYGQFQASTDALISPEVSWTKPFRFLHPVHQVSWPHRRDTRLRRTPSLGMPRQNAYVFHPGPRRRIQIRRATRRLNDRFCPEFWLHFRWCCGLHHTYYRRTWWRPVFPSSCSYPQQGRLAQSNQIQVI